mmetsp:Transcript_24564/g.47807  ORF Transcript_24564/g.47807 Transcript_24564/m.47807 type:complete len:83 (+) Transcript_24564:1504-1752(+)
MTPSAVGRMVGNGMDIAFESVERSSTQLQAAGGCWQQWRAVAALAVAAVTATCTEFKDEVVVRADDFCGLHLLSRKTESRFS